MAGLRSKASVAIGSSPWVTDERQMASQFIAQDMEDFAFSARNEMDWLNEHMADVFNNNQMNLAEMLKTPGKLRGKTPRTVRKRNALENRKPLTDIFTDNSQIAPITTRAVETHKPTVGFKVAEDPIAERAPPLPKKVAKHGKANVDSGYHGMTEDEMDLDITSRPQGALESDSRISPSSTVPTALNAPRSDRMEIDHYSTGEHTTEGSFHSAEEVPDSQLASESTAVLHALGPTPDENEAERAENLGTEPVSTIRHAVVLSDDRPSDASLARLVAHDNLVDALPAALSPEAASNETGARSPSEASSPVQPLIRKSSLNFASLPAREPLATKKSIGTTNTRTSHLEQVRKNGSYFGRHTGGKSIGSHPQDESEGSGQDERDDLHAGTNGLHAEESDGDSRTTKLHHKTSTQRLQGKINMLAQSQPPRSTKPNAVLKSGFGQAKYPDLPSNTTVPQVQKTVQFGVRTQADEDEDEWIPSKSQDAPASNSRPHLTKSYSADVMEQISGKSSIGNMGSGDATFRESRLPSSPLKQLTCGSTPSAIHAKSNSTSVIMSPQGRPKGLFPTALSKQASISNPDLSNQLGDNHLASTTPAGSPTGRRYADGPLSASKAKLSSLLKSARGIFANSAGVSAQAKMETMSPSSLRNRPQNGVSGPVESLREDAQSHATVSHTYPAEKRPLPEPPKAPALTNKPSDDNGRRTRSSTEREAKNREKEVHERQKMDAELQKTREKERQRTEKYKSEKNKSAEEKQRNDQERQAQSSSAPNGDQAAHAEFKEGPEGEGPPKNHASASILPAATDGQQISTQSAQDRAQSQDLKSKEPRRPMKPSKDSVPKSRPAPVSIRVDTVSQWGLDHRKMAQQPNPPAATQNQEPAPPAPQTNKSTGLQKKASNNSLQSSSAMTGSKFGASGGAGRPKALDEREAHRKLELKRENERKRAVQQEEERRQEHQQRREAEKQRAEDRAAAVEEQRKIAQRQALEKRRLEMSKRAEQPKSQPASARIRPVHDLAPSMQQEKQPPVAGPQRGELGNAKPPSRMNSAANVRSVQDDSARPAKPQPHINPAKPPKRALQDDASEDSTNRQGTKTGAQYQQNEQKRRRTNEEDQEMVDARQAMPPPPIRRSNMNGGPSKALFANGYANATHNANNHMPPSIFNPANHPSNYPHHSQHTKPANPMSMATYSSGKIPFADGQGNKAAPGPVAHKTPANKGPVPAAKSSPRYPNGDLIELPEIATDSEDEDEENEFVVPEWAKSPNLDPSLLGQELWNPEEVFGPPNPTLHVEEIFTSKDRHHRFRARTSSANWNGQDRLTQDEIEKDLEARQKLIANGGWTYGL
ncbi:MAG: hypothetical protein M4579_000760 [Chaenotheca gracillima]|nr:MAG: hypothetical protein M4579_000760 [Chaenotheca gracillima]